MAPTDTSLPTDTTLLVIDVLQGFLDVDRLGLEGVMSPAAAVHAAALSDLSEAFATIVTAPGA